MVLRVGFYHRLHQCRLLFLRRFCHSSPDIMQNAYVRYSSGAETFSVSFHYSNQKLGIDRNFNFSRKSSETVSYFLQRVQQNVEKVVSGAQSKKRKKMIKKAEASGEEISKELDEPPIITVELLRNGRIVPADEICGSVLESSELLMLCFPGKKYHIIFNAPSIDTIQLPKSMLCGFPVYPSKFEGHSVQKADCLFSWYRLVKAPDDWLNVGSGFMYTPSSDDIGHILKVECEPRRGSICGQIVKAVSTNEVEAGPGPCPFEIRHAFTKENAEGKSVRVVSYNILAGLYSDTDVAKTELFPYCPPYALNIDYRKQLLLKEILGYNADIICLQEVDTQVFENDLLPILSIKGFAGVHHKKGSVREGLACFVNTSKFRLIDSQISVLSAELSERPCYSELWGKVRNNEALLTRLKDKATSSQATILQSVENPEEWLVVGNTHLYFHPDADHIRLLQGGQSILFFEEVVANVANENQFSKVSLLFCGDFNSTPDCGIFRLMTSGYVPEDVGDWSSKKEETISGISLSQPFKLESACGTPPYTNYTVGFAACIDYIFYQTDRFHVKQVVPFYSEDELQRYTALPNVVFPSDHIALVADLERTE